MRTDAEGVAFNVGGIVTTFVDLLFTMLYSCVGSILWRTDVGFAYGYWLVDGYFAVYGD